MRFRGTILPATDSIGATAFLNVRLLLRVRPQEAIRSGMVIRDPSGRYLLVGDHDATIEGGWSVSRAHALFVMTDFLLWQRNTTGVDPVTQLATRAALATLSTVWCAVEHMGALQADIGTRMMVEKKRIITGSPIQPHDLIGGMLIKRVIPTLAVYVGEVE